MDLGRELSNLQKKWVALPYNRHQTTGGFTWRATLVERLIPAPRVDTTVSMPGAVRTAGLT